MTRRLAILATLAIALVAAVPAQAAPPTSPPLLAAGTLTVGLNLPTPGFQVGAVAGDQVVLAKGFEIDLATELAKRLELNLHYVQQPVFTELIQAGTKPWDIALAQVTITKPRLQNVDFSARYLVADQGVLLRRGLKTAPKTIAALQKLVLCSEQGTTGADVISSKIKPTQAPLLATSLTATLQNLQNFRCDAAIFDAPILGAERKLAPSRYGALAGRIVTGERYGIVLPKGSALKPAVDEALRAMSKDGSLARMQKVWLTADLSKLRVIQ